MKKFFSIILTVMMCSVTFTGVFASEETEGLLDSEAVENELVDEFQNNEYIDLDPVEDEKENEVEIEKKPYIEEEKIETSYVDVLVNLGLISRDDDSKRVINRGEFAHYLCFLAGYHEDGFYGNDMGFTDTAETSHAKEINCVASSGYMNGYGNGIFAPSKGISTVEAATAILRMAGYKTLAENDGGYPNGYIKFASTTGLFEDVTAEESMTYENMVQLIYNALFVPIVELDRGSYVANSDINVLVRRIDAECLKGQITATEFTTLGNRKQSPQGHITVTVDREDYVLSSSGLATDELLGLHGYFYIRDEETLIAFEPLNNKYSSVKIARQGIVSINDALTELEAIKEAGSNTKSYKIDPKAEFIYNGKNCFEVTRAEIENLNGNLRLIDTDNDREYDIVYIWHYDTYFVDSIIPSQTIVNDKRTGVFLKLDETLQEVRYKKYGKTAEFANITQNDVLSVAISKDDAEKPLVTINISSSNMEGVVTYIGDERLAIDGVEYEVSQDFDFSSITVGTKALFGINFMDEVSCYKKIYTTDKEYAYLTKVFEREGDYGDVCTLEFLSENSIIETAPMAEKFYLNNERCDAATLMSALMVDGETKKQLIAINRNRDGEILKVYVAGEATAVTPDTSYEKLTFNKKYTNLRIRPNSIQGDYIPATDTKIFLIVLDRNSEVMEDSSSVYTPATNPVGSGYRITTYVYDAGEDLEAGAMVYEVPESSYSTMLGNVSTFSMLINKVSKEIDENNDEVTKIHGFLQGAKATYTIDDTLDVSTWKKGDIRMLSASKKTGNIVKGKQFFGITNETGAPPSSVLYRDTDYTKYQAFYNITESSDNTSQESPVYGTVKSVSYDKNYVIVELADGSGSRVGRIASYSHFFTYSDRSGFSAVTKNDIVPGAEVYMMTRYAAIMEFVMFED